MSDRRTFTPDECETVFHAALKAGDARGVEAALLVMAPQDPHRAERLYDDLRAALAIARVIQAGRRACSGCGRSGGELTEDGCPECGPSAEIGVAS